MWTIGVVALPHTSHRGCMVAVLLSAIFTEVCTEICTLTVSNVNVYIYRGSSRINKRSSPKDPHRALAWSYGRVLGGGVFL
jgi:hypothetical protein